MQISGRVKKERNKKPGMPHNKRTKRDILGKTVHVYALLRVESSASFYLA